MNIQAAKIFRSPCWPPPGRMAPPPAPPPPPALSSSASSRRARNTSRRNDPRRPRPDIFEIEARAGKIILRGNDAVSVASALNWYLKYDCHCDLSWRCGDQLRLPDPLPSVPEKIRVASPHQFRYAYNFCAHGYTMAWWHWPQWEKELDFLALSGVNLALVIEGQESVWLRALREFGYTDAQVRAWLVPPSHLPWMLTGNMESYGGPVSRQLTSGRLQLGQKSSPGCAIWASSRCCPVILAWRRRDFRIAFRRPGFSRKATRGPRKRPDIIDPSDPVFAKVAAAYYKAQNHFFGGANFYAADPFLEGGVSQGVDLPAAGRAISSAMNGAAWVVMSWWANPNPAMIDGLDRNKLLVLDLFCEQKENWRSRAAFNGAPWLWCAVNNFGGNDGLSGRLAWMAQGPVKAMNDPAKGRLSGIGATMEGTGTIPALWEMFFENAWRANAPDLPSWLDDYAQRRYGAKIPAAEAAWRILLKTAYDQWAKIRLTP